jgi:hypothetical protein
MPGPTSNTTQNVDQDTSPWGPQAHELKYAFGQAHDAYGQSQDAKAPDNFVAGMTPAQISTFRQMLGYSRAGAGMTNAQGRDGTSMMSTGMNGVRGALSDYANFDPSQTYNTDAVLAGANRYADNPAISGMVSAAMRDANQNARDIALPSIDANTAMTGNVNSSRTGLQMGVVQRGLAEKAADISANLRGDQFNQGLNLTDQMLRSNIDSRLQSMQGRGALGSSAYGAGNEGVNASINNRGNLFALANMGGAGLQQGKQLALDNELKKYQSSVSSPFASLQQLMSIIGSANWGNHTEGTTTQQTQTTLSPFQVAGGILGGLGSLGFKPF